jgi:hypothetical protein
MPRKYSYHSPPSDGSSDNLRTLPDFYNWKLTFLSNPYGIHLLRCTRFIRAHNIDMKRRDETIEVCV